MNVMIQAVQTKVTHIDPILNYIVIKTTSIIIIMARNNDTIQITSIFI